MTKRSLAFASLLLAATASLVASCSSSSLVYCDKPSGSPDPTNFPCAGQKTPGWIDLTIADECNCGGCAILCEGSCRTTAEVKGGCKDANGAPAAVCCVAP